MDDGNKAPSGLARKVMDGFGVEFLRDILKSSLMYIGGFILAFIVAGFGDFTLSLRSFDWFGWYNDVDRPNQTISPDAVWKLPMGTVVKVRNGGYFTMSDFSYRGAKFAVRYTNGELSKRSDLAPGETMVINEDCRIRSFQPMSAPVPDEPSMMLLYTDQHDGDEDCRRWWQF